MGRGKDGLGRHRGMLGMEPSSGADMGPGAWHDVWRMGSSVCRGGRGQDETDSPSAYHMVPLAASASGLGDTAAGHTCTDWRSRRCSRAPERVDATVNTF
jgi:hypothetical protein